jgi:hypothetical protein
VDDLVIDVGEVEVTAGVAVRESIVVESQEVEESGVEVMWTLCLTT